MALYYDLSDSITIDFPKMKEKSYIHATKQHVSYIAFDFVCKYSTEDWVSDADPEDEAKYLGITHHCTKPIPVLVFESQFPCTESIIREELQHLGFLSEAARKSIIDAAINQVQELCNSCPEPVGHKKVYIHCDVDITWERVYEYDESLWNSDEIMYVPVPAAESSIVFKDCTAGGLW